MSSTSLWVPVIAEFDVTPRVARTIDAGVLIGRLDVAAEFAPLRAWTTQQAHGPPPTTPPGHPQSGPLTAVNDPHRLSHLRQAQVEDTPAMMRTGGCALRRAAVRVGELSLRD